MRFQTGALMEGLPSRHNRHQGVTARKSLKESDRNAVQRKKKKRETSRRSIITNSPSHCRALSPNWQRLTARCHAFIDESGCKMDSFRCFSFFFPPHFSLETSYVYFCKMRNASSFEVVESAYRLTRYKSCGGKKKKRTKENKQTREFY